MRISRYFSLILLAGASTLVAQQGTPASNAKVRAALDLLKADNAWTIQQQIELTQIPSPPFKEQARGLIESQVPPDSDAGTVVENVLAACLPEPLRDDVALLAVRLTV